MFISKIDENRIPIKSWCNSPESGAIEQAYNLAKVPFTFKHVALMPDTHRGVGMPIGGVIATKDVVIPNAVGVDIGCGMIAVKTSLTDITIHHLKQIMSFIREHIPVGFDHHKEKQDESYMPKILSSLNDKLIISKEYQSALYQIGSLGGGNHFCEIQKGSDGNIWFMLHSGSRNLGYKVANHYDKIAKELNFKFYSQVPEEYKLAFLPLNSNEGKSYIEEMQFCIEFSLANRKLMSERIKDAFKYIITQKIDFIEEININHNYARMENHFGENVMIHRKGATSAREGELGLIPGSQGSSSYVVKGKGNKESFESCSHGAGRKFSRTKAKEFLNLEEEIKKLNDKGIIHGIRSINELDEASGAYKDIENVMEEQKDLVDIVIKLEPLAVIKG